MKKFMFAAMAALAITGCSQSEEFDAPSQKVAIGFNTVVSKTTRAAITDLTALQTSGFTVNAYTSADKITTAFPAEFGTLMNGEKVTCLDKIWTNTKEYYWPLNDKVHFYAYATDAAVTEYVKAAASTTYPTFKYTVAAAAADQKDFVVAKLENQEKSEAAIQLAFTHALTQVNFTAQGNNANLTYTLKGVTIKGVAGVGTYSFGTNGWTVTAPYEASYVYPIAETTINGITPVILDGENNTLMLMPQAMTDAAKIFVSYSVSQGDNLIYQTTGDGVEIELEGKAVWGAGKKIRYSLTLTQEGIVSMTFAPIVGPWDEAEVPGQ